MPVSLAAVVIIGEGDGLRKVAMEPGAIVECAHFAILVGGWVGLWREREEGLVVGIRRDL